MSEIQYNIAMPVSIELASDEDFNNTKNDILKASQFEITAQADREVERCLLNYINKYELNPAKDIMVIVDANGNSYQDIKYNREIVHKSWPTVKETEGLLGYVVTVSIILRKNYE